MLLEREIESKLLSLSRQYPILTMTGPRQSGKTTLCKKLFSQKPYVSLEDLNVRRFAEKDPLDFLKQFPDGAVLDEVQRAPHLFSYLQTIADQTGKNGMFVLTGSSQFHLMNSISQSLAGRTAITALLPFSFDEAYRHKKQLDLDTVLYTGFYPRIFDKKLNPTEALSFYASTYLERDVRTLIHVKDLSAFETFIRLCAGRTGQILQLSSLANDCGINHNTAKSWLSVLEASYIIFLLKPHHKNFNKRLIKSPKLYFIDVGLACALLNVEQPSFLRSHPLRGALFETFIVSELLKTRFNKVKLSNLYYYRDNIGNEVDLIADFGTHVIPIEIKLGQTVSEDYFKPIRYYQKLNPKETKYPTVIYTGEASYKEDHCQLINYKDLSPVKAWM